MWTYLDTGGVVLIRSGAEDDQDEHHRDEELYSKSLQRIVITPDFCWRSWQTWPEETFSATAVVPRPAWPLTVLGTITWRMVGWGSRCGCSVVKLVMISLRM